MRFISLSLIIGTLLASQAFASKITHFTCVTQDEVQGNNVTIKFSLKNIESDSPEFVGDEGHRFKISPARKQ